MLGYISKHAQNATAQSSRAPTEKLAKFCSYHPAMVNAQRRVSVDRPAIVKV
jgi:hypothetical protein